MLGRRWAAGLVLCAALVPAAPAAAQRDRDRPPAPTGEEALVAETRAELKDYTRWLQRGGVKGIVGEVGWPVADRGWTRVAEAWARDARARRLRVYGWATGEWWRTAGEFEAGKRGYALSFYDDRAYEPLGVDFAIERGADVLESLPGAGVTVAGAEFGAPGALERRSTGFSNLKRGVPETAYHYEPTGTFAYLRSRGLSRVRLPFRWERVQPTPLGPLDESEVARLVDAVQRARTAGVEVLLDVHNFGAYWLDDGTGAGVRTPLGSPQLPERALADLWTRLSERLIGIGGVEYGLMNEPARLPGGAATWERASAAAVRAVRARGDRHPITVAGYDFSSAGRWPTIHRRAWVRGAGISYEAHHYWDSNESGTYTRSFKAETRRALDRAREAERGADDE